MMFRGLLAVSALVNFCGAVADNIEHEDPKNWHINSDYGTHTVIDEIPDVVIIVGDIHGDIWAFKRLMQKAGVLDNEGHWINHPDRTEYLIQLGDVVDRGPRSGQAVDLSAQMYKESRDSGDLAFNLIGNHELFLMCGQFGYFSHDELRDTYDNSIMRAKYDYSLGGDRGKIIRSYLPALKLNDTYFVHAGVDDGFRNLNVRQLQDMLTESVDVRGCSGTGDANDITGSSGPFWTRKVSGKFNSQVPWQYHEQTCNYVDRAASALGVEKVIVGHTVTETLNIEPWCDGKWTMHDTGLSRWMMSSHRFSVMYKTTDSDGKVLPLSKWVHVMWEDTNLETDTPLKGTYLNMSTLENLDAASRAKFISDIQKYQEDIRAKNYTTPIANINSHNKEL